MSVNSTSIRTNKFYFITLSFNQRTAHRRRRETQGVNFKDYEFDGFNLLYNHICRKLIGRNYSRPINQDRLLKTIACIDTEGTRFWIEKSEIKNKHIHSIRKTENANQLAFEEIFLSADFKSHLDEKIGLDELDVQKIPQHNFDDVKNVIAYSSKFIQFNEVDCDVVEDFRIYPRKVKSDSIGRLLQICNLKI